ncbi:hypothetical protein SELMODRAFT_416703 [Selaginella moellendorffii]|uniref:Uncharacterized protein n=1 Tax=Selaginella moellendorffii TaxID=88036 RepID=D8S054_SELML|nr:hypothetical protein SELMODRAFT_416703 [Selaginella moellendorffii]
MAISGERRRDCPPKGEYELADIYQGGSLVVTGLYGVALVYALLVHVYMLESRNSAKDIDELKTQQLDMHVIEAIQDKAIGALEKFAEATGNDLPADMKSLKPEYIKLFNQY